MEGEVQKKLNMSLSLDVVISVQQKKQMQSELVEANTEMTEHITADETEHLESLNICDHFNELLRQFKHELHGKLEKGEEKLSNITDFVQQLVSTEDLCDVKDLDEVLKKLDCYYNFLDYQIIVLFAERFASPALLQKFENHSKEALSHTIKILQNSFDVNFNSHQTNASISLHIAWGNVIIDRLYMLIERFSVKHESHIVLKHITVTESSVHIEYLMRNSSMEIEEVIAHAQENVSFVKFMWFMWFIGIYEFTINEHIILQVNNEENFTFELALLNAARTGHNEAVQFLLDLTDNTDHCNEEGTTALMLASEGGYEPVVKSLLLAGANVNSQANDGWTALMKASKNNHITIVHTLLEAGADLHLQISNGGNALMIASYNGYHQVVEELLKENVDYNHQQKNGMNALMYASINGHSEVVELLLNAHANPNIEHSGGLTALMFACEKGHSNVVELLLNAEADPNIQNSDRVTALMKACSKGHFKVVELLLNRKANPNIQESNGCTVLMLASHRGYSEMVELLLKEADPNIQNTTGHTSLRFANQNGHFQTAELLLNHHANPNIRDMHGNTALYFAVLGSMKRNSKFLFLSTAMTGTVEDYIKIIQLLIGHSSIDIDAVTDIGFTSLMCASTHGSTEAVELLLEAGANPNIQIKTSRTLKDLMSDLQGDKLLQPQCFLPQFNNYLVKGMTFNGYTALMFASFEGHLDVVQILLQAKAKPDLQNENGETALYAAALKGYPDIVQLLLEYGADPNISNRYGETAIHAAASGLNILTVIARGDTTSMEVVNTLTALISCNYEHYLKTMKLLIVQPNIKINETNLSGVTMLMQASVIGNAQIIELLLQAGADPNISIKTPIDKPILTIPETLFRNESHVVGNEAIGRTALMLACECGHLEVVQLLLKANANPNHEKEGTGITALIIAANKGFSDIVQQLLEYGADPNIQDSDGCTALMQASLEGYFQIVELLLKENADPNIQNTNGHTALRFANQNGHFQTVELLLNHHANPNIRDMHGYTELHFAVFGSMKRNSKFRFLFTETTGTLEDYIKIVQLLIGHSSIDIDAVNYASTTSLMLASIHGCTEVVKLLLEAGANPNIQIKTSITMKDVMSELPDDILLQPQVKPLFLPQYNNYLVNGITIYGITALMLASFEGHLDIVQILLQAKAIPDLQNETGDTALLLAAMKGHADIVQQLLECGANPNISNRNGSTPLYAAVYCSSIRKFENDPIKSMECEIIDPGSYEDYLKIIQLLIAHPNVDIVVNTSVSGCTSLHKASMGGCIDTVKLLLQVSADPNIQTHSVNISNTNLSYLPSNIILQPHIKPFLLINDFQTPSGGTALMFASENGHSEIVQLLLNAKAKPDLQTDNGETALHVAAVKGYPDIVQLLLEYGADPNISNRDGETAIHAAASGLCIVTAIGRGEITSMEVVNTLTTLFPGNYEHYLKTMKLLIAQPNIKINETNSSGFTILMQASIFGSAQIVELLLQAGADPNISIKTSIDKSILTISETLFSNESHLVGNEAIGWTALMIACEYGHLEVVQQLLEYGADPNIRDKNDRTAIHYIMMLNGTEIPQPSEKIMSHKLEILQLLIVRGINVNIKDRNGMTALMKASFFEFTEAVKLLLQAGADPNIEQHITVNGTYIISNLPETHTIGVTALIYACSKRMNLEVVNLLLKANANPNQENAFALMIAAEQRYPDIVQQLLEYGADPNSISNVDGSTALHFVVRSPTDTPHKDDKEKTAIKLAIIQQLIIKGANIINIQNEDGLTALMMATDKGLSEIIELLLQNGADPNIHNNNGRTALMCACNHGNHKVAQSLVRYNANPQLVDNDGFTASIHALRSGNKGLAYEVVNDRDFSQNELKCLLIMDLIEGDQTEAFSRLNDITDLTTDKKELLISCAVGSLEDVISKLHESGLHPDTPLVGGLTLLMIASSCGYIELVEHLVIIEADVNQRDMFWKYTPLFYAILGSKSNEIVELLLENGADINAVAGNQTPLDMANSSPVKNLISSLLIEHGGQTFSEMTSVKSEMQPPIKKKSPNFAKFSDQVKSLIQDTVVKREHTEYTHT